LSCTSSKNLYITLPENHPQNLKIYTDLPEYKPLEVDKKGNFFIIADTSIIATSTSWKKIWKAKSYYSINNSSNFISEVELWKSNHAQFYRSASGYVDTNNKKIIGYIEYVFKNK
jgi:hypothetical protein